LDTMTKDLNRTVEENPDLLTVSSATTSTTQSNNPFIPLTATTTVQNKAPKSTSVARDSVFRVQPGEVGFLYWGRENTD